MAISKIIFATLAPFEFSIKIYNKISYGKVPQIKYHNFLEKRLCNVNCWR